MEPEHINIVQEAVLCLVEQRKRMESALLKHSLSATLRPFYYKFTLSPPLPLHPPHLLTTPYKQTHRENHKEKTMPISLANSTPSSRPSAIFLRQHIHGPKWGYTIFRTNYDPVLEPAWQRTLQAIRDHLITSIEGELHKLLQWVNISAADHARIRNDPSLFPPVDPTPVDEVKAVMQLAVYNDVELYDGLSPAGVREAFHALCMGSNPATPTVAELLADSRPIQTRNALPASGDLCLMVDGEVLRVVSQDLRNEFGEGLFVKAVERLPALGPDYEGWFKVALTYLWRLVGQEDNSGGMDQSLPPKRRASGERPIYNGGWPLDVQLQSAGIDPDELAEIEEEYGRE